MVQSYLERYLRGGQEQAVWHELVALGGAVREEPLAADAEAVVRETIRRARHNLEVLIARLRTLKYRFESEVWWPLESEELAEFQLAESVYGPLPLTIRMWFETIGQVSLIGYHPKLSEDLHQPLWFRRCRDAPESDPLQIMFSGWDPPSKRVELFYDSASKAGYSGGGEAYITLPQRGIDAPLEGTWTEMLFMDYVRLAFQWGGFPGLSKPFYRPEGDRFVPTMRYAEAAREELAFLTQDLLPL